MVVLREISWEVVVCSLPLLQTQGKGAEWPVIHKLMPTTGSLAFSPCIVTSCSAALCDRDVMDTAASVGHRDFPLPPSKTQCYEEPPKC